MPRKARKNLNSKFLHIMVQGLNKEYIFNEDREIKMYLKFLSEYTKEFNLKIIAYCLMNNHAHLLVFTDDVIEISKFMKKVNTKYAIYYNNQHNRCGYVFRNRYRAEEIYSQAHLLSCINYIHNNPVKAGICKNKVDYKYSSYNSFLGKEGLVSKELVQKCLINNGIDYKDVFNTNYETFKFIEYEEVSENAKIELIEKFLERNSITLEQLKEDKVALRDLVVVLNIEYNITQKEIAEKLGINKTKINRILKNEI